MSKATTAKKTVETTTETTEVAVPSLTKEQQKAYDGMITKSGQIRYLASQGFAVKDVHKIMKVKYPNFRYQHARNVMTKEVKKPIEQV